MPGRHRFREKHVEGSIDFNGFIIPTTYPSLTEEMYDSTGPKPYTPNGMSKWKFEYDGGFVSDETFGGQVTVRDFSATVHSPYWDKPDSPPPYTYASRILAASGPLTPRMYLPLALYELKDIPSMLRHAGNLLHGLRRPSGLDPVKEAAAAHLAYAFGWEPLWSDLNKLLKFSDGVSKTQQQIAAANSNRGIRRKIPLDSFNYTDEGSALVYSGAGVGALYTTYLTVYSVKQWGTVRWKLRDPSQIGRKPSYNDALRQSLGLTPGAIPVEIWKGIPWTWMIDWFADISSTLQACTNLLTYQATDLCVMKTSSAIGTFAPIYKPDGSYLFSPGKTEMVWKERYVDFFPSPLASLRLPFISSFKLAILGDLTITRLGKR